jgi:hypothetical protein
VKRRLRLDDGGLGVGAEIDVSAEVQIGALGVGARRGLGALGVGALGVGAVRCVRRGCVRQGVGG